MEVLTTMVTNFFSLEEFEGYENVQKWESYFSIIFQEFESALSTTVGSQTI